MKCRHDKCKRKADEGDNCFGYCNQCIQLNTKECNFCLMEFPIKHEGKKKKEK